MIKNEKQFIALVLLLAVLSGLDSYIGLVATFIGIILSLMYLLELINFRKHED